MRTSELFIFALVMAAGVNSFAQDVVSAASGVLQYFEGQVFLDDKPVEHKAAVFPSLKNGSFIHTERGRAELLLTPATYLRLDDNTSLKMLSNSLTDTRLTLTQGSIILDNLNAPPGDVISLTYEGSEIRFPHPGIYRIDSDVGELQAFSGDCIVKNRGSSTTVDSFHRYYLALDLTTPKSPDGSTDEFYDWAANRGSLLTDQNQLAAAEKADAQDPDSAVSGMFVVPPITSASPIYATPTVAYSGTYPSYAGAMNPFYMFSNVIFFYPYRYANGGTRWPGNPGNGLRPIITRWPSPTHGPVYRPIAPTHYNPVGATSVRTYSAPIPRAPAAAPRVGAIGHH